MKLKLIKNNLLKHFMELEGTIQDMPDIIIKDRVIYVYTGEFQTGENCMIFNPADVLSLDINTRFDYGK